MPGGAPPRRRLEIRGELLTLREIAERYGIPYRAIHDPLPTPTPLNLRPGAG